MINSQPENPKPIPVQQQPTIPKEKNSIRCKEREEIVYEVSTTNNCIFKSIVEFKENGQDRYVAGAKPFFDSH